jgi:hypothetical protein
MLHSCLPYGNHFYCEASVGGLPRAFNKSIPILPAVDFLSLQNLLSTKTCITIVLCVFMNQSWQEEN